MAIFELEPMKHHVLICNGGTCMRHEGEEVTQAIRDEIREQNAEAYIHTTRTRCNGTVVTMLRLLSYTLKGTGMVR